MTKDSMPSTPALATSPDELPYVLAAAFNTGDPDALDQR
jgi:hypothetical protein